MQCTKRTRSTDRRRRWLRLAVDPDCIAFFAGYRAGPASADSAKAYNACPLLRRPIIVTDNSSSSVPSPVPHAAQRAAAGLPAPLKNRLLCMVYEAMLLFGVLFIATWLFSTLLQQRHALYLRDALQDWLFVVLGLYFGWFWPHGGKTLAMKTWRIRVVSRDGQALRWPRALLRYGLAWGWLLPGLALARVIDAQGWMLLLLPALNLVLWAMAALLDRDRQFLHDRLAGTRIVLKPGLDKKDAKAAAEDAGPYRNASISGGGGDSTAASGIEQNNRQP